MNKLIHGFLCEIELDEDTLAHYGIKGMKWRHRKARIKGKYLETRAKVLRKIKKVDPNTVTKDIRNTDETIDPNNSKSTTSTKEKNNKSDLVNPKSEMVRSHKYYKRITLANGKYRYFYSEAEYNRYLKRINVLNKDYSFMQDVPVLSEKPTASETVKKADIGTDAGNCSSCSMAFELRMRGYDVQSRKDTNGATIVEIDNNFKDFEPSNADNWYLNTFKKENKGYYNKGLKGGFSSTSEEEKLQIAQDDLERSIKERGGNNQRGFMYISWTQTDADENGKRKKSGGGHVFNYIVENGQVKFYDAQKNDENGQMGQEIDIKTYLDNTDYISHRKSSLGGYATYCTFQRVDDKDLSEDAKKYISYNEVEVHDSPQATKIKKVR